MGNPADSSVSGLKYCQPGSIEHIDAGFLADKAAILDLVAAYSLFYDSGDFDALGQLFTEDAQFTFTPPPKAFPPSVSTRERIVFAMAALRTHNTESRGAHQRHLTTNTVITRISGTTAEAQSLMCVSFAFDDGRHELGRSGLYSDVLEKEGARWRIASRHLWLMELPRIRPFGAPADRQPAGAGASPLSPIPQTG